jgi:hypothetical protein
LILASWPIDSTAPGRVRAAVKSTQEVVVLLQICPNTVTLGQDLSWRFETPGQALAYVCDNALIE